VHVHGKIYCPESQRTPDWTAAIIHPTGDFGNYLHFVHCGSLKGEFSFLLPPGQYDFAVHSESPDARMPKPFERAKKDAPPDMPAWLGGIRVEILAGQADLNMGTLNVELPVGIGGIKGDYSRYYGKRPPELSITDARGVPREVKLSDLRGKWVLLDFWTLWCGPCVRDGLPRLTKLYAEHAADRDRFEILSICVTAGDEITTIEKFDERAAPLVEKLWDGKPLPFPVLIDGEGKTGAAYGVTGYPTVLLIDPEGNLVKFGDEAMLADKLAEPKP
jgi:thiol-disulfide isomerase/thioredoxin